MENYCAFSKNHKCLNWTDYELTRYELEEAGSLCQANWIEIERKNEYIQLLQALLDDQEGFLSWLDQQRPIRGSRMDKAVTYIQNRRSYLSTYLEDGRCSFSNNLSENAIRPFTVGRKNWLFCDTPNGAQASAIVYTMVEMAKANGVNVYHYLTYLLEKLPDDRMSDDELELLAPWNETVKAEIERRANESNQSYVNCQGAPATEK